MNRRSLLKKRQNENSRDEHTPAQYDAGDAQASFNTPNVAGSVCRAQKFIGIDRGPQVVFRGI